MSEKRRGLGRGLGALIPESGGAPRLERPVDVFFRDQDRPAAVPNTAAGMLADAAASGATSAAPRADGTTSTTPAGASAEPEQDVTATDEELAAVPGATFAEVPVSAIRPNPKQPRTVFDEDDMAELVHSIQEIGVLQPIVVRRLDGVDGVDFELIMGERRWRASKAAGNETVPAIIKATEDDALLRDALLENLHRSNLNVLEEAAAYRQLLDDFGCSQEELAGRIGRSRPQISNTLRLLRLPPLVARRVAAGVLSAGHARALLTLEDGGQMERLAQRIVAEGLSVRTVEELVALGEGEQDAPRRAGRAVAGHHPELEDLAGRLSDRLDTRVSIRMGKHRGRLTVDFSSAEDLDRILDAWQGADQQR